MVGKTINNYVIERKLGTGGMGEVYYAKHNKVDREVAIKVLHSHLFLNKSIHNRFKNEANALIKLNHPNIVKIFDYVEQENFACLIMEYINGYTLDEYIEKVSGPLPSAKATSIICNVLDAVQYAHDCNVYHRDIKPANIMISKDGHKVRVMDFGIAKLTDSVNFQTTHANTQLGTPFYMSPEQIKGLPYSRMSDIYSLGVTLFEMVTGKCPYLEITNLFDLQLKIITEPLPPTSKYYPDVTQRIQNAISIATKKVPEQRFQNCNDFKNYLTEKDSTATPLPTTQLESINTKSKETQTPIYLLAIAGGVIVVIILFFLIQKGCTPPHRPIIVGISKEDSIKKADSINKAKIDSTKKYLLVQNQIKMRSNLQMKQDSTKIKLTTDQIAALENTIIKNDTNEFKKLYEEYFRPIVIFPNNATKKADFWKSIDKIRKGTLLCTIFLDNKGQIRPETVKPQSSYNPLSEIAIKVNFTLWESEGSTSEDCYIILKYKKSGNQYLFSHYELK